MITPQVGTRTTVWSEFTYRLTRKTLGHAETPMILFIVLDGDGESEWVHLTCRGRVIIDWESTLPKVD